MDRGTKFFAIVIAVSIIAPPVFLWLMFTSGADIMDLVMQALFLCLMIPLIVMGAYMWATGKGAMLIAGYNTSSKALRDLYDSVALAKFTGMLLTVSMTIMLIALESIFISDSLLPFWIPLIASIAVIIAGVIYMNTGGRFLKEGVSTQEHSRLVAEEKRNNRDLLIGVLALAGIVTTLIVIIILLVAPAGSVEASLEESGLHIEAPAANRNISYDDIASVELRDTFDAGRRVGGFGGNEVSSGNFRNDEFGRYVLAQYNSVSEHIVVHHTGGVLVFNLDTSEKTIQIYEELQSKLVR